MSIIEQREGLSSEPAKALRRCIIIDDDPDIAFGAAACCATCSPQVAAFQAPEEAIAAMEAELPDVILLDANFGRGADAAEGFAGSARF